MAAGLLGSAAPFCPLPCLRDAALVAAVLLVAFFDTFFPALPAVFLVDVFVAVTFFRDVFFRADLRLDAVGVRPALRLAALRDDFLRGADLPADAPALAFRELTFRFLPVTLLPAEALRDPLFFRATPAAFCFLLAAFFAGMVPPAGPRKTRNYTSLARTWKPDFRVGGTSRPDPVEPRGAAFGPVPDSRAAGGREPAGKPLGMRRPGRVATSCLAPATIVLSLELL